jgi:nucleotide-binding universal stress UspA family protein
VLTVTGSEVAADTGTTHDDVLVTTDGSDLAAEAAPYAADVAGRVLRTVGRPVLVVTED